MKRKILLTAIASVLFVFALAMCIGATTIYRDSAGNELFRFEMDDSSIITAYEGEFPKTDSEGNALTWYVTATGEENGNAIKTVASVLTLDENYATLNNGTYSYKTSTVNTLNVVSVNFPSDKGITTLNLAGSGYKRNNGWDPKGTEILFIYLPATLTTLPERVAQGSQVLVCDMPSEMPITTISRVAFYEAKCLREINIPSTVTLIDGENKNSGAAFYACSSLERVTFGENSQLEKIGKEAFTLNSSLKYVKIPDTVKYVGYHAFSYTQIEESPFGMGSLCEEIGGRAFSDNTALKSFIVPATLKKVEILGDKDWGPIAQCPNIDTVAFGNSAPITELQPSFFGKAGVGKIILPNGPTYIPDRYFIGASIDEVCFSNTIEIAYERVFQSATVKTIRLGSGFKHFVNSIDDNHSFTHAVNGLEAIYMPATFYAEKPDTVYHVGHAFECGNANNVKIFYTGSLEELAITLDNFKNGTKNSGTSNSKFTGAKQVSYADYIKDTEAYASGSYIVYDYDSCDAFCVPLYTEDMDFQVTITYESYLENGTKAVACPVCKTLSEGETVDPLFVCCGYSVPENGEGGISVLYIINKDEIGEYERATGKSLAYGVFVASYEKVGENDILDADGTFANGAIGTEFKNKEMAAFEIKVIGFITDAQKNAKLIVGAYTIATKGEEKIVTYIQPEKATEGSRYNLITFNDYNLEA